MTSAELTTHIQRSTRGTHGYLNPNDITCKHCNTVFDDPLIRRSHEAMCPASPNGKRNAAIIKLAKELEQNARQQPAEDDKFKQKTQCPICNLKVKNATYLKRHFDSKHHNSPKTGILAEYEQHIIDTTPAHLCKCGSTFSTLDLLDAHVNFKQNLLAHDFLHQHHIVCKHCNVRFKTNASCRTHTAKCKSRPNDWITQATAIIDSQQDTSTHTNVETTDETNESDEPAANHETHTDLNNNDFFYSTPSTSSAS